MADQSILISTVLPASPMPLFEMESLSSSLCWSQVSAHVDMLRTILHFLDSPLKLKIYLHDSELCSDALSNSVESRRVHCALCIVHCVMCIFQSNQTDFLLSILQKQETDNNKKVKIFASRNYHLVK